MQDKVCVYRLRRNFSMQGAALESHRQWAANGRSDVLGKVSYDVCDREAGIL